MSKSEVNDYLDQLRTIRQELDLLASTRGTNPEKLQEKEFKLSMDEARLIRKIYSTLNGMKTDVQNRFFIRRVEKELGGKQ